MLMPSNEPRSGGHGSNLKQFTALNDRLALLIIAGDYLFAIAVAAAAIVAQSTLATLAAIVLIAGRQVAFLNLVHAAAHYSLFSTRKANNRADALIGYPILDAVRPYRSYHLQHHRDVARKSPDRFDYLHDKLPGPDAGPWRRAMIVVIKPLCGFAGFGFVRSTIDACRENPAFASKLASYWGVVVGLFWWAGHLGSLLVYWVVPLVWLYPAFYFWAEMSDHYAARDEARNQRGLFYMLFIKGHEMYHAVHHKYPAIPFYRIRAANQYLRSHGEEIEESRGFLDFMRILCTPTPDVRG